MTTSDGTDQDKMTHEPQIAPKLESTGKSKDRGAKQLSHQDSLVAEFAEGKSAVLKTPKVDESSKEESRGSEAGPPKAKSTRRASRRLKGQTPEFSGN